MQNRTLEDTIFADLKEKMVFIGGPRQVGKTTLARMVGEKFGKTQYLLWDTPGDRRKILNSHFDPKADIVIFDELHKYRNWKNLVKGICDTPGRHFAMLVTGSARLNLYRRGGDSLQGRYHYYRLSPFTLAELISKKDMPGIGAPLEPRGGEDLSGLFQKLLTYGGFPEPLFKENSRTLRRWHGERVERLVREDVRDTQNIREISRIQILADLLPDKVASLLSINSLREDLEVSHKALSSWIEMLENFYYCFRVYPFASTRIRALKKEPKLYLWDWSEVPGLGSRLENMVATHLLTFCHYLEDAEGYRARLQYIRDSDGREADFLVSIKDKPWFAVEVKSGDRKISKNLRYFGDRLEIPLLYQLTTDPGTDYMEKEIRVISADRFLSSLI